MLSQGWPGISLRVSTGASRCRDAHRACASWSKGPIRLPHNIEMPLPLGHHNKPRKPCPGNEFVGGCNFFPNESDTFVTEIFQKDLLPAELPRRRQDRPADGPV